MLSTLKKYNSFLFLGPAPACTSVCKNQSVVLTTIKHPTAPKRALVVFTTPKQTVVFTTNHGQLSGCPCW